MHNWCLVNSYKCLPFSQKPKHGKIKTKNKAKPKARPEVIKNLKQILHWKHSSLTSNYLIKDSVSVLWMWLNWR